MSDSRTAKRRRRLIVLGCTGSIGVNTLRVVENLGDAFEIVGLTAGSNADTLVEQAKKHEVSRVAIANPQKAPAVEEALTEATIFSGDDAAEQLVRETDADIIVAAIVGAAGLPATIAAIEKGMDVALANKETLIAAGELVVPLSREHGVHLLPVDSEHSAIFQCIQTYPGSDNGELKKCVKKIVLTASGGPFRTASREEIEHATVEQALNHPTWNMGPKITIDSATMMNKALEIIEAHWLFGLAGDQIDVIVHPQSIAHSFVEFTDHSMLSQLGPPDMKTPIQYALTWPNRTAGCSDAMDWKSLSNLIFEQPDFDRFPSLGLAYRVIELGGTAGAVFNAANEAAVAAFLDRKIPFGQITAVTAEALESIEVRPVSDLDTVLAADGEARAFVTERVGV